MTLSDIIFGKKFEIGEYTQVIYYGNPLPVGQYCKFWRYRGTFKVNQVDVLEELRSYIELVRENPPKGAKLFKIKKNLL